MFKKIFAFVLLFPCVAFADDLCSRFQYDPDIKINKTINDDINITKSDRPLNYELGHAIMQPGYESRFYIVGIPVDGGYCMSLRGVDINFLYPDFNIVVDKNLKDGSCAYNHVLKHEKDHVINTRKVLDDNLKNAEENVLAKIARSIKPVFVAGIQGMDAVRSSMGQQFQNHPDMVAFIQKIQNEIEQENQKIDTRGDQYEIYKCQDFFEESKNR